MYFKATFFAVILGTALCSWALAAGEDSAARPAFLGPRDFSWQALANPESLFWPGPYWCWNGPLKPDVLRQQLRDMAAHDVRTVWAIAMPHEFRPDSINNRMDVNYLSPEYFDRVKSAVDEAAKLGMNYCLYDEGGWPSGQACGQVLAKHPEVRIHALMHQADGTWKPDTVGVPDLLDPQATDAFISMTHDRYAAAVGAHFGKTIKFMCTDEPGYLAASPGHCVAWPKGAKETFQQWFGYNALDRLDAFASEDLKRLSPDQKKVRIDLYDFWARQFRDAYFLRLRDWCRKHGIASAIQPNGEDETIGAVRYGGYGNLLRQDLAADVPSIDAIWRQVFPGKVNHHFPKFASSAAHQNGTALTCVELFAVYGNGLTPAEMKWCIDSQYAQGMTQSIIAAYLVSTRDHLMGGDRPDLSPINPLWDFLPDFYRYAARLGYVLACGQPAIETALYYPVRDIWASGDPADPALLGHDALAQKLWRRQCDYDIIDDDSLGNPATRIEDGRIVVGNMRYRTIVVGPTQWMSQPALRRLDALKAAGGQVVRIDKLDQMDSAVAKLQPTVMLNPPSSEIRVLVRRWPGGGAAFLFNEGKATYRGTASVALDGNMYEIEPATGNVRAMPVAGSSEGRSTIALDLAGWESTLLVVGPAAESAKVAPPVARKAAQTIELAGDWTARADRHYVVGKHDYEVQSLPKTALKPVALGRWAATLGLGEDFSGHVTYRRTVDVPKPFQGKRLVLDLGGVEYAARVSVDGKEVGCVLWSPWRIELPSLGDRARFVLEIKVSNTLANELTSRRVRDAWAKHKEAFWHNNYDQISTKFEMDSRGGGLLGPVRLETVAP